MGFSIEQYHGSYNRQRRTTSVRYIVVHYTGSGTSRPGSARANCIYFSGGNRNASAHYFIDDEHIFEYADPGTWSCWHVGDGHGRYGITNQNSVGIEVCNNGGEYTDAEKQRLQWLVGQLMGRFGVPASRVVRHYDASRKCCPAPYAPNGEDPSGARWNALHAYITGGSSAQSAPQPAQSAQSSGAGLVVDGLWGSGTTTALQRHFGTPVDGVVSGQWTGRKSILKACTTGWQFSSRAGGSLLIAAMQRTLGIPDDGVAGPQFVNALEQHYGYAPDGRLDCPSNTVRKMQQALNEGRF